MKQQIRSDSKSSNSHFYHHSTIIKSHWKIYHLVQVSLKIPINQATLHEAADPQLSPTKSLKENGDKRSNASQQHLKDLAACCLGLEKDETWPRLETQDPYFQGVDPMLREQCHRRQFANAYPMRNGIWTKTEKHLKRTCIVDSNIVLACQSK